MDVDVISIGEDTLNAIIRDCERRKPEEACGVLVGRLDGKRADVSEAVPMSNVLSSSKKFLISPNELYRVWMDMEEKGKQILGAYHSHPDADAGPTHEDEDAMKNTSFVWMIIGMDGFSRAYVYNKELKEIPIEKKSQQKV